MRPFSAPARAGATRTGPHPIRGSGAASTRGPAPWIFGCVMVVILAIGSYLAFTKELPFTEPGLRGHGDVRERDHAAGDLAGADRRRQRRRGHRRRARRRPGQGHVHGRRGGPADPRRRRGLDPPAAVPRGQLLPRPLPRQPERARARRRRRHPDHQDVDRGPARRGADRAPGARRAGASSGCSRATAPGSPTSRRPPTTPTRTRSSRARPRPSRSTTRSSTAADAGRGTAIVNTALLGNNRHDLSGFIRSFGITFGKLADRSADLSDLITNFNTFAGALADESTNLSATLAELAPTLEEAAALAAGPQRRAARGPRAGDRVAAGDPGAARRRSTSPNPWLTQTRALVRRSELGGLARLVKNASPGLAQAAANTKPTFQQQTLLSRCTSGVLVPAGDADDQRPVLDRPAELPRVLLLDRPARRRVAGLRRQRPLRPLPVGRRRRSWSRAPNPGGIPGSGPIQGTSKNFANVQAAPEGVQPVLPNNPPPFRPEYACHKNLVPDLNGPGGRRRARPTSTPVTP